MTQRRRHWLALVLVAAGCCGLASTAHAGAPDVAPAANNGIELVAEAGVRGWHEPTDHVIVQATVTSPETIDGEIEVEVPFNNTSVVRDVQVAGGTTKEVFLVVPTAFDQRTIEVRLVVGGQVVADDDASLSTADTVEIVGILPALATRVGNVPEQVSLPTDLGRAQLEQIPDEYFALGPTALDVYDTIIGVGGDLTTLDDHGVASLLSWINHGGRLLLDDAAGLEVLPESWRPGTAGFAWAGRGEVRMVNGLAGGGRFADIIEPSTSSPTEQPGGFGFGVPDAGGSLQDDLARRAGVELPSLTPILIGMLIYVVVVGPVLYIALRMWRRLALAWIVVPGLALLTAGVVLVVAHDFRDDGTPAASAFADGYPGGSEDRLALLTFTRSGGTSRVAMPSGWQVSASQNGALNPNFGGPVFRGAGFDTGFGIPHRFSTSGDSATFQACLEPGQVTNADFIGEGAAVGLRIEATAEGRDLVGTVTNDTTGVLYDVAVFSAGDSQLIGTLAAGASATFELNSQPQVMNFGLSQNVWSRPEQGLGFGKASDKAEFAIWSLASERLALYPTGLVRAAGWTDERPSAVNAGRDVAIRSVITTTAPIQAGEGPLSAGAMRTVQVRAPFNPFGGGTGESATRYLLPADFVEQQLVVDAAIGMRSVEFWEGNRWIEVDIDKRLAVVPPAAIRNGTVLMRVQPDINFAFDPNQVLLMRGATVKDQL